MLTGGEEGDVEIDTLGWDCEGVGGYCCFSEWLLEG